MCVDVNTINIRSENNMKWMFSYKYVNEKNGKEIFLKDSAKSTISFFQNNYFHEIIGIISPKIRFFFFWWKINNFGVFLQPKIGSM